MGIASHAPIPHRREGRQLIDELAVLVEEFLWLVASHPGFKNLEMLGVFTDCRKRNLVRAEGAFDRNSVHFLGTGPSLGGAQDDHGPDRLFLESILAGLLLN